MSFESGRLRTALVLALAATLGCSDGDDDDKDDDLEGFPVIPIGALGDLTGPSKSESYGYAIALAKQHMNTALEQVNIPIRFDTILADSRSNAEAAANAAVGLMQNHNIKGLVSDTSADTVAVNRLNYDSATTSPYKVPITCYACSSAFINNPSVVQDDPVRQAAERDEENWLYRVFYNGRYEAATSVRIMLHKENGGDINRDGIFKVSVYAQNDNFGQASAQSLAASVEELLGDQPFSIETIFIPPDTDPASYNWAADLDRLVDNRNETTGETDGEPDGIFLALLPLLAGGVVSARTDLGYMVPMQSVTAFRRNYVLRSIGEKAVGLEGGSPRVYAQDDSGEFYANAYQSAYGDVPEMLSSHVYDCAATLMLGALKAAINLPDPALVDPSDVRAQMLSVTDVQGELVRSTPEGLARAVTLIRDGEAINYSGPSGVFPWDEVGDTFPELVHWTVVNDGALRFREDEAYDCSPERACELIE